MEHQFDRVNQRLTENSCNFFYGVGTSQQIQSNNDRRKHGSNDKIYENQAADKVRGDTPSACQSFHSYYNLERKLFFFTLHISIHSILSSM
jgi:hypothetical protein